MPKYTYARKNLKIILILYSELQKNIVKSQLEFEMNQNILFYNLKNQYNQFLQLFLQNSKKNDNNFFSLLNERPSSIDYFNNINISKKSDLFLLNKKTNRNEIEAKQNTVQNKKGKIFNIKKIKDREKEAKEEKRLKKYIYRGSKYRGVSRNGKTWQVLIMINRNKNYIGNFKSEEDAAKAYDEFAMKYHKNKARLNFSHQGFIKYINKP